MPKKPKLESSKRTTYDRKKSLKQQIDYTKRAAERLRSQAAPPGIIDKLFNAPKAPKEYRDRLSQRAAVYEKTASELTSEYEKERKKK